MKLTERLTKLLLVGCLAVTACSTAHNIRTIQPEDVFRPGDTLTVLSFNIRVGYGRSKWGTNPYELRSGPEKLEPIIAAIQSVDPDIVGLQEVLHNGQAGRIAKALNLNYTFTPHPSNRPWWGVAILSKYPIIDTRTVQVSNRRNALIATIDIDGTSMVFASFHKTLDKISRNGSSFRRLKSAIEGSGIPTVLIGDFNVRPGDPRFKILGSDFVDTAKAVDTAAAKEAPYFGTWGTRSGKRIDYVLVRRSEFETIDAGIVEQEYRLASDHLAYFAKIRPKF